MWIIVPRRNLTQRGFLKLLSSFREISDTELGDYTVKDPDAPIFSEDVHHYSIRVKGMEFSFSARYVRDDSYPEERWPVPPGTGLLRAYIWDKWGPHPEPESREPYKVVARTVMKIMEGILANYQNEVGYDKIETFRDFLGMYYESVFLSKEVVDSIGRERLVALGSIMEFDGGIEFVPRKDLTAEQRESIADLLHDAEPLRCLHEKTPPPVLDIGNIGTAVELDITSYEKETKSREREDQERRARIKKEKAKEIMELVRSVREQADTVIKQKNRELSEKIHKNIGKSYNYGDKEVICDVYREVVRVDLALKGLHDYYTRELVKDFCGKLLELRLYEEAEQYYRMLLDYQRKQPYRRDYYIYYCLGKTLLGLGRRLDAIEMLEEAVQTENPTMNFRDYFSGLILTEIAEIHLSLGNVENAKRAIDRAWPMAVYSIRLNPTNMVKYLEMKASIYEKEGRYGEAEEYARKGAVFAWSTHLLFSEDVARCLEMLVRIRASKLDVIGSRSAQESLERLVTAGSKEDYVKNWGPPSL